MKFINDSRSHAGSFALRPVNYERGKCQTAMARLFAIFSFMLLPLMLLCVHLLSRAYNIALSKNAIINMAARGEKPKTGFSRDLTERLLLASALPIFAMSFAPNAAAQQREIVNPSFEQVNPNGSQVFSGDTPLPNEFTIASEDYFPGWSSTNGQIEIWADGFQNRTASEGDYLAELNPSDPVGLFQEVCLVNGETLSWSFDHSARTGSAPTLQTTVYEVVDSADNLIQFLDTSTVTEMGNANDHSQNAWVTVSDTAVYTGPTGTQRLQFRSTNAGSNGNFLDNIGVILIPLVTFENLNTSALETATTGLPQFVVSGNVTTSFDISFTITGGTATQGVGADYTVNSNSITIPVGNYDGVSAGSAFPLPITILTDSITEGNETIEITYQSVTPSTAAVLAGPSCSSPSPTAIHTILDVPPSLDIEKVLSTNADGDNSNSVSIGDVLTYTITATNTGNAAQTGFVVTDALITPNSNTCTSVAAGGSCVLTGTYVVQAGDADGDIVNTASVVSDQVTVPLEDTVTTPVDPPAPSIGIVKTLTTNADGDNSGSVSIGDILTYTIVATNTGNAAQTNFVVTDNLITPSSNSCATVAVGGTCTLTGTYVVTMADAGGDIVNTASVVSNEVPTAVTDSVTTPVVINPIIAANDTTTAVAGASNVLDLFDGDTVNGIAATPTNVVMTLASGETVPAELTFDAATGAVGVSPSAAAGTYSFDYQICESVNPTNCTTATATVTVAAAPAIDLVKTLTTNADGDNSGSVSIGDILTYTIVATNTGNAAQTNFVVTDNLITPSSNSCATVAVGGTCTLTGTYVVTMADAGGDIVNTASVVSNEVPTAVTDSVTTPVDAAAPAIGLVKTLTSNTDGDNSGSVSIGDTLTYTIVATNTGNTAQTNFVVTDPLITPSSNSCATVAVGGTCTLSGTYVVTVANAGGDIVNTASVVSDQVPTAVTDSVTTPVDGAPIIEAEPDVVAGIDSAVGGTGVINVLDDDLLNGQPINPGQVTVVFSPDPTIPTGITYNADGAVDVAPGVRPGTYVVPYEICDVNDATNCTTSNLTVTISAPTGLAPLNVTKSTQVSNVNIGDIVPYTITVTNTEDSTRFDLDLVDIAPPGFSLIDGTSRLGGVAIEPVTTGRELVLDGIDFTANETKVWTLHMVVGAGVSDGIHINQAFIRDASGAEISARAEAVVKMSIDPLFDCSEVIGKVYDDMNRNGYQDQGEPGIAGVRLATVKGLIIISDEHGRYHIACADVPNANIGSNFILKVDERSLPTGYRMTTENPRVERLTRGKISKINFGASIQRVVTLDLSNEAFLPGSTRMQAAMMPNIVQLINVLKAQPSILRLNYHDYEGFSDLSERRLKAVEAETHRLWNAQGCCYTLETERKVLRTGGYRPNHVQRGGAFR